MEVEQETERRSGGERRIGIGRRTRNRRLNDAPVENEQRMVKRRSGSVRRGISRRR